MTINNRSVSNKQKNTKHTVDNSRNINISNIDNKKVTISKLNI